MPCHRCSGIARAQANGEWLLKASFFATSTANIQIPRRLHDCAKSLRACVCVCKRSFCPHYLCGRLFVDHKNEVRVTHLRIRNALLRIPLQEAQQIMRLCSVALNFEIFHHGKQLELGMHEKVFMLFAEYVWSRSREKHSHIRLNASRIWAAFMHKRMSECDANVLLSMDTLIHISCISSTSRKASSTTDRHLSALPLISHVIQIICLPFSLHLVG